ncbi:hypothetical protein DRE_04851 [Drechslerella stenobrocha 248]|uniref:Mannan polymerase II complex ANP1 subunit n=1 Tax=Drechslerella stenobrocha 248 TaxID=1043628 RepID=W7HRL4_9PEZI|nr:hypothetical protein DRE_04851 [Drechslerella stenobrocha 248]
MEKLKALDLKPLAERVPPARAIAHVFLRTRFLVLAVALTIVVFTWNSLSSTASSLERRVPLSLRPSFACCRWGCYGPGVSPLDISPNEFAAWHQHKNTPILTNKHDPIDINAKSINNHNLNKITTSRDAVKNRERVLILTPLRDAAVHLPRYFEVLSKLTYPHDLIDLGFLVSDSTDDTLAVLAMELDSLQLNSDPKIPFRSGIIIEKDFGVTLSQNVQDRHSFAAQGPRRKAMGKARNFLLYSTLQPEHSWVMWRDVDIKESPETILEDFIAHDKDVICPNIWFHRFDKDGHDIEGRFDYNSWVESDQGRQLRKSLPVDTVLAEGYKEYKTNRTYMAKMGDWRDDKDVEMDLDGIGGVSILVKADVHRAGINFPSFAFENQAETEGFAQMAKRAGYRVIGLPNYVVWHIDTEEKPGNA